MLCPFTASPCASLRSAVNRECASSSVTVMEKVNALISMRSTRDREGAGVCWLMPSSVAISWHA